MQDNLEDKTLRAGETSRGRTDYDLCPEGLKALEATRKRADKRRQQTAYHEAGHAVMAEYLGYPVRKVSIVPEGNIGGYCSIEALPWNEFKDEEVRTHAMSNILICFAGHAAESLFNRHHAPHTIDYIASNGGGSDCEKAWRLSPIVLGELDADATREEQETYQKVCRSYLDYQVARAYKLIRSKPLNNAIKVLANELLGWDELTGNEAREVMLETLNSVGVKPH